MSRHDVLFRHMETLLHKEVEAAVNTLSAGGILLYPTDTVWGLGCDACNGAAVERLFALKGRDRSKSMLVLALWDIEQHWEDLQFSGRGRLEHDRPVTYIVPADLVPWPLSYNLLASDGTIGVRNPNHEFCRLLLQAFGKPVVSTSANFSGTPTPSRYQDIDPALTAATDYCVKPLPGIEGCGSSSRIVKIEHSGQISIIRP